MEAIGELSVRAKTGGSQRVLYTLVTPRIKIITPLAHSILVEWSPLF